MPCKSLTPKQIDWAYKQWCKGATQKGIAKELNVSEGTINRVLREKANPQKHMKTCKICGKQFIPATYNQLCCSPFCTEENGRLLALEHHRKGKDAKANETGRKRAYSLSYITAEIAAYNKKHGTHLTYGKYVMMKERGLLEK